MDIIKSIEFDQMKAKVRIYKLEIQLKYILELQKVINQEFKF